MTVLTGEQMAEKQAGQGQLERHKRGLEVTDAWYAHIFKEHEAGKHEGVRLNLCPMCQA